ncbi:alpha/beta hydrolase [Shewanella litorisediminis]|uniref:Alpha/beta hydrolase n=1 Tax=Shewanella litorisediminis TaxID=1173586 RepID=A0ABX7G3U9_9GAMM|nr:alpha/beta hydrolase-fold protein [Shewanella litorisediminis]MCL2919451.1 alpha/beta hydrolase [Shewanella litorisediminis]QRH01938.1 alpha/beta hydrolase [Shewanella litorisediminis]
MTRIFTLLLACAANLATANLTVANTPTTPKATGVQAASLLGGQRGSGQLYEVVDTQVWDVPDPKSGRDYQVFVALPASYEKEPSRRYPVLYVTDADYAFAMVKQIARRLNGHGPAIEDFILVGLSYSVGDHGMPSRRRDYTPTPNGPGSDVAKGVHGEGKLYLEYLKHSAMPFIAGKYRTDEARRLFLGHSYGGLLGAQALLTDPDMFAGYVLGSPSFWYDNKVMWSFEKRYAKSHKDLPAKVYLYVGEYEDMKPSDARYATRYNMVTDARYFEKTLKSRQYPSLQLKLDVLNDEDHLSVAPRGFTHGLKYLLPASPDNKS